MIHQYIKELVENNSRIIIPDFGAFMVQNSPEGKQISFNDFLKFNDGLLVNQVIKTEKINKAQAGDKVKAYVKDIEASFNQKKPFEVEGLGYLIKDEHGNIKFEKNISGTKQEEQKAQVPTTPPTDSKPTIELAEEDIKVEEAKEIKKEAEPAKPEAKKEEPKPEVEKPKEEVKPEIKTPDIKPRSADTKPAGGIPPRAIPSKPIEKKAIPSKPVSTATKTTAPKPEVRKALTSKKPATPSNNSDGSSKVIFIIIAAVILIGGGLWAGFHFEWFGKKEVPVVIEQPVPVVEPVVEPEPEPEPKVVEEPDHDPNAKKYYIVAGSFKVANNADSYNQKLIDEGYPSEVIERNNGFHTVSYKTFYDWHEALSEWRNMRDVNEETWILIR